MSHFLLERDGNSHDTPSFAEIELRTSKLICEIACGSTVMYSELKEPRMLETAPVGSVVGRRAVNRFDVAAGMVCVER